MLLIPFYAEVLVMVLGRYTRGRQLSQDLLCLAWYNLFLLRQNTVAYITLRATLESISKAMTTTQCYVIPWRG